MGNSPKLKYSRESILWLDQDVYNDENKSTYEKYLPKLKNYNFFCFTSVKKLINYIIDNLNYFEFRLFYVIVSGRLAESFFNEYVQIAEKYNIIADTIVYCFRQKYHQTKPYFKDNFLNPGGITLDFEDVANYILKDKLAWKNITKKYKKYIPENEKFGETFKFIDVTKEYNLALTILIGSMINSSFVEKDKIIEFQNLLLSRYCKCYEQKDLKPIKPSIDKNLDIPLHILIKFFIRFYSLQVKSEKLIYGNNFYNDLNKDLSNNKFQDYRPFILLIYDCLNREIIKPYKKKLYRATKITKNELKNLIKNFNKNKNEKPIYRSTNFLSFSKDIDVAYKFLEGCKANKKPNEEIVLFILDECKNEKYFVSNIDIESLSSFKSEKEALHLPLSSFEIVGIEEVKIKNKVDYFKIYLNHLDKYQEKIDSKIEELRKKNDAIAIKDFLVKSTESELGKTILENYDKQSQIKTNFGKIINAQPNNPYFLNLIAAEIILKQNAAHVDDEIQNLANEIKCNGKEDKDICKSENKMKLTKFFDEYLTKYNISVESFDNSFSLGYCLGNFFYWYQMLRESKTEMSIGDKAINLASFILACGPHLIRLIPKIKDIMTKNILLINNYSVDLEMILDGLNLLWVIGIESFYILKFYFEYKNSLKSTLEYAGKRVVKIGSTICISIIGKLIIKAGICGIMFITGIPISPFV